jgi:hypothetical protein
MVNMIDRAIRMVAHYIVQHVRCQCINPDEAVVSAYLRRWDLNTKIRTLVLEELHLPVTSFTDTIC